MARTSKESVDNWFDHNVDLTSRTMYMGSIHNAHEHESGVDAYMAEYAIKGIHLLERNSEPITIVMNNPGGDFFHGLAIYDAIKCSPCHCTIKVYGHAMSMGSLILQAADKRVIMPNARFMIHYGYDAKHDNVKTVEKWIDEGKRLAFEMENIYLNEMMEKEEKEGHGYMAQTLSRIMARQGALEYPFPITKKYSFSKKPETKREEIRNVLKEMLNFDTILNAEETVALGFADEIFKIK